MVSVIVPTFNRSLLLKKCLDSIVKSTLNDIEIIVIDDGSTDDTKNIVDDIKDERIKYYYQDNHGIGYSRNRGIKLSKGNYIVFVDSDDYIDSNMLFEMEKRMTSDKLDILICDYNEFDDYGNLTKFDLVSFDNCKLASKPSLINEINLGPCNKMFKKELLIKNNINFEEKVKYEDVPFVVQALSGASLIGKINANFCYFLYNNKGETRVIDNRIFDIFKILDIVRKTLNNNIYKYELNKLIVRKITTYTISTRMIKDNKCRNKFIDEAFIYLKNNVGNYKNKMYYKYDKRLEYIIKKSKILTKVYCNIYSIMIK